MFLTKLMASYNHVSMLKPFNISKRVSFSIFMGSSSWHHIEINYNEEVNFYSNLCKPQFSIIVFTPIHVTSVLYFYVQIILNNFIADADTINFFYTNYKFIIIIGLTKDSTITSIWAEFKILLLWKKKKMSTGHSRKCIIGTISK